MGDVLVFKNDVKETQISWNLIEQNNRNSRDRNTCITVKLLSGEYFK